MKLSALGSVAAYALFGGKGSCRGSAMFDYNVAEFLSAECSNRSAICNHHHHRRLLRKKQHIKYTHKKLTLKTYYNECGKIKTRL